MPHLPRLGGGVMDLNGWDGTIDDLNACYQRPPIDLTIGRDVDKKTTGTAGDCQVPPALHDAYRAVLKEAERIWCDRQAEYGLTPFDLVDVLTLVKIKLWRLQQGQTNEDSLLDLLNYAAIGLLVSRGLWKE